MSGTDRAAAEDEYLVALASGDRRAALEVVGRLRAEGMSVLAVMTEVIGPAQYRVGELWAADDWSVAQEHAATAVSESVLAVLANEIATPDAGASPVVVACVEQEWHALPARIVAEHIHEAGIPISYLGANASAEHLVRHIHEVAPRAVALSCSLSASLPRVRRQIEAVRETGTPVIVGGAAFDGEGQRARTLCANGFARSAEEAIDLLESLPTAVPPAEPLTHPGAQEALVVHADREQFAARVRDQVFGLHPTDEDQPSSWRRALLDHLPHLVGSVAGALVTNDPRVLTDSLAWTDEVLLHRAAPEPVAQQIRGALAEAMRELPSAARMVATATNTGD